MSKLTKAIQKSKRERMPASVDSEDSVHEGMTFLQEYPAPRRPEPSPSPEGPKLTAEPRQEPSTSDADPDERLVCFSHPNSYIAQSYRRLRDIVEQQQRQYSLRIVAVTSPQIGDGKTLTSINLAGALSQNPEARVLLIDGDLRRPSVARHLGLRCGRSHDLVRTVWNEGFSLASAVMRLTRFNLDVLPTTRSDDPYPLLKSRAFQDLMDQARESYDYVVVDTPPVPVGPDSRQLAECADGVLIVVSAHTTSRMNLHQALEDLPEEKVLGVVFNRYEQQSSRYYSSYYSAPRGP